MPVVLSHGCVQASKGMPVGCTVLFSSIAAVTGPAGSANYAAANAYMDSLAKSQHQQGKVSLQASHIQSSAEFKVELFHY